MKKILKNIKAIAECLSLLIHNLIALYYLKKVSHSFYLDCMLYKLDFAITLNIHITRNFSSSVSIKSRKMKIFFKRNKISTNCQTFM